VTFPVQERAIHVDDGAVAFIAETQVFYNGEDFVEVSAISDADLRACAAGRFVTPRGQWHDADRKLGAFGGLIVIGERGSGRRTAALRLLNQVSVDGPIYELVPTWKRPGIRVLPDPPGRRCLLDMSEPTIEPASSDFGKRLLDWAREKEIRLVVIAADETRAQRWAESAGGADIRLGSPDARALVDRELRMSSAGESQIAVLDHPAFASIWESEPKVEDALRLVQLILARDDRTPEDIASEYQGWRKWIEDTLSPKELGTRTLMWAAAFCDGGQRRSVLRMSEDLRRLLGDPRTPAAILSDTPASQRLSDAEIRMNGEAVRLSPTRHGLANALRAHLWHEFQDQELRDVLTDWLVAQLGELPFDDAERVALGVLDLVTRFRDDALLRALRDKLTGDKRSIAVRTLSQAALDARFGTHVRASLYAWAKTSKSQADLVAEVCAGPFGDQQPEMALVRLGWAAQNSLPNSQALATAVASLAGRHPDALLKSIAKWFGDSDRLAAGINAFLALASTSTGASLLSGRAAPAPGRPGFQDVLTEYFRRSLSEASSFDAAIAVLKLWEEFAADGTVHPQTAISVLGRALGPSLRKNPMGRLHSGFPAMDSFWGQTFGLAMRNDIPGPEKETPHDQIISPESLAGSDGDADAPALTPSRSTLAAGGSGTDTGVEAG
jgi:hypothetical protein